VALEPVAGQAVAPEPVVVAAEPAVVAVAEPAVVAAAEPAVVAVVAELVLAPVRPFHRLAPRQIQSWQWAP
jgi:hypothetical protein